MCLYCLFTVAVWHHRVFKHHVINFIFSLKVDFKRWFQTLPKISSSDICLDIFACIAFIISFSLAYIFDDSSFFLEKTFNSLLWIFILNTSMVWYLHCFFKYFQLTLFIRLLGQNLEEAMFVYILKREIDYDS